MIHEPAIAPGDAFDDSGTLDPSIRDWQRPAPSPLSTPFVHADDVIRPATLTVRWWASGRAFVLEHDTAGEITLTAPDARALAVGIIRQLDELDPPAPAGRWPKPSADDTTDPQGDPQP